MASLTNDLGVITATVQHNARTPAAVHMIILDANVVAPLGCNDAVLAFSAPTPAAAKKKVYERRNLEALKWIGRNEPHFPKPNGKNILNVSLVYTYGQPGHKLRTSDFYSPQYYT